MGRYLAAAEMITRKDVPTDLPKPTVRTTYAKQMRPSREAGPFNKEGFRILTNREKQPGRDSGPIWQDLQFGPHDEYKFVLKAYAERDKNLPVQLAIYTSPAKNSRSPHRKASSTSSTATRCDKSRRCGLSRSST